MRFDRAALLRYRAMFGVAYVLFGAVAFWRVAAAQAPLNAKLLGSLFGIALVGLGIARIVAFARPGTGPPR